MSSPFPFFVMLSESIELEELANALGELIPRGHRAEVVNNRDPIQAPIGDDVGLFALVHPMPHPDWPSHLDVCWIKEACSFAPYQDLKIAEHVCKRFGIDAFCEAHPFVEREKPDFPGWALAYVAGQWHLADDYAIDDDEEEDGSPKQPGPLKLVRPVVMHW